MVLKIRHKKCLKRTDEVFNEPISQAGIHIIKGGGEEADVDRERGTRGKIRQDSVSKPKILLDIGGLHVCIISIVRSSSSKQQQGRFLPSASQWVLLWKIRQGFATALTLRASTRSFIPLLLHLMFSRAYATRCACFGFVVSTPSVRPPHSGCRGRAGPSPKAAAGG